MGRVLRISPYLFAATWAGCMMGPADDSTVASTSAALSFFGAHPYAGTEVSIEQLDLQQGTWTLRATARASTTPVQDQVGTEWFVWQAEASLDASARFWQWTAENKLVLTTLVRGRSGPAFQYATFRSDEATAACIEANQPRGGYAVRDSCASGDTVRLHYQVPLRGATDCPYGASDCNPCVANVATAFQRLSGNPTAKLRYRSHGGDRLPPLERKLQTFASSEAHVQGIARLAGWDADLDADGLGPWFVFTRSTPGQVGQAGLFVVHLADLPTHGGEAIRRDASGEPAAGRETRYYYPIDGVDHPGGLQTLGQLVFVASDCDREEQCGPQTFVDVLDLSQPSAPAALLQRFQIGLQGEPGSIDTITSVSVARLETGHVLLFVLGKDALHEGWFYVSDRTTIDRETRWLYRGYWTRPLGIRDEYQSTTFVSECETGDIYMFGTGNGEFNEASVLLGDARDKAPGTDSMSLLKLARDDQGQVAMDVIGTRSFDPGGDGYCTFRAAASVHPTRTHELAVYCSARKAQTDWLGRPDSKLKLEEFAFVP